MAHVSVPTKYTLFGREEGSSRKRACLSWKLCIFMDGPLARRTMIILLSFICVSTWTSINVHVYVCVRLSVCLYVCLPVSVCVYVGMYVPYFVE